MLQPPKIMTNQENTFNTNARGYYFNTNANKFLSKITLDNKSIHLGLFHTEKEARQAYLDAKEKYHKI